LLAALLCLAELTSSTRAATATSGAALADDTVVLSVGGRAVAWSEYRFWLNFLGKFYRNAHQLTEIKDWDVRQNGLPLKDYFLGTATSYACNDSAIEQQAATLGVSLSADDVAELQKNRSDGLKIYGSRSEYLRIGILRLSQSH
jgi:hypothetical protein